MKGRVLQLSSAVGTLAAIVAVLGAGVKWG
jgi:hypothetical protein